MADVTVDLVHVFTHHGAGGNPRPIVRPADEMSDADMRDVARRHGHESRFVLTSDSGEFDWRFRYWVPNHEMEMCGHATVGALWLLARHGALGSHHVRVLWGRTMGSLSEIGVRLGFVDRHAIGCTLGGAVAPA